MAQLVVRNLDDEVEARLLLRAQDHGCSLEDEVRTILRQVVGRDEMPPRGLGSRLSARFAGIGLPHEIPELRGEEAHPAVVES